MIAIIDYDAGNIKSVEKAFQALGQDVVVTRDKDTILQAEGVILPGVGAFGDAMKKLEDYDLVNTIYKVVEAKTPFLGICLGLQLMFEESEETPGVKGLGLLKGKIVRIPEDSFVYFVHSYYLQAEEPEIVKATTEYGVTIHASVEKENVFACQFHPEKSSAVGMKILENFVAVVKREA